MDKISIPGILLITLLLMPVVTSAGNLEPDTAPDSTMYTLEDIYKAITPLPTGFVLWEANPRFAVLDRSTPEDTDDIVLDRATNLMWTRNANQGSATWQDAMDSCDSLVFGKRTDWRLPTREEFADLVRLYPESSGQGLPSGHPFTDVGTSYYWSSTEYNASFSWTMRVSNGYSPQEQKTNIYSYWPVRSAN